MLKIYNTNILKNKTIAPGTNGSFDIVLDATGANVAIDYAVTFDNLDRINEFLNEYGKIKTLAM